MQVRPLRTSTIKDGNDKVLIVVQFYVRFLLGNYDHLTFHNYVLTKSLVYESVQVCTYLLLYQEVCMFVFFMCKLILDNMYVYMCVCMSGCIHVSIHMYMPCKHGMHRCM